MKRTSSAARSARVPRRSRLDGNIACRPRRNGNTAAGRAAPSPFITARLGNQATNPGNSAESRGQKGLFASKLWVAIRQMPSDYSTCAAMFGNGVATGLPVITTIGLQEPILRDQQPVFKRFFEALIGFLRAITARRGV